MADVWAEVVAAWEESGRAGMPWRAGMLTAGTDEDPRKFRLRAHGGSVEMVLEFGPRRRDYPRLDGRTLDPNDPATLGALLGIVREVWDRPSAATYLHPVLGWIIKDGSDDFLKSVACDTEFEALCRAIIAGVRRA